MYMNTIHIEHKVYFANSTVAKHFICYNSQLILLINNYYPKELKS